MKIAVIDKDGTLVKPASGNTFVQNPLDQELIPGTIIGCRQLIDAGYTLRIASNQGGVAAGHKTLSEAIYEMHYCMCIFEKLDIHIDRTLFCPDFEGKICYEVMGKSGICHDISDTLKDLAGSSFRKPGSAMLEAAIAGTKGAWMVGDREEDRLAAAAAGCKFLDAIDWHNGASPWQSEV